VCCIVFEFYPCAVKKAEGRFVPVLAEWMMVLN
jgi:hypothetical protein